jgi:transposase-like protein
LLAERRIDVSYETVRWVTAFGPRYARHLRATRPMPSSTWHLDEMFVSIGGRKMYLWRAVDTESEVLDILVQSKRDKRAAERLMRKLLRKNGMIPSSLVTEKQDLKGGSDISDDPSPTVVEDTASCRLAVGRRQGA